jgi:hypothetical protein
VLGTDWTGKIKPLRVRANQLAHTHKCFNNSVEISRRSSANRFFTGNGRQLSASSPVFEGSAFSDGYRLLFCSRPSRHTYSLDISGRHCVCQRPSVPLAFDDSRVFFFRLWTRPLRFRHANRYRCVFRHSIPGFHMRKGVDHVSACVFRLSPSGVYSCLFTFRPRLFCRHRHTVTCRPVSSKLQRSPSTASFHLFQEGQAHVRIFFLLLLLPSYLIVLVIYYSICVNIRQIV